MIKCDLLAVMMRLIQPNSTDGDGDGDGLYVLFITITPYIESSTSAGQNLASIPKI